jgi:hypothetical protein
VSVGVNSGKNRIKGAVKNKVGKAKEAARKVMVNAKNPVDINLATTQRDGVILFGEFHLVSNRFPEALS